MSLVLPLLLLGGGALLLSAKSSSSNNATKPPSKPPSDTPPSISAVQWQSFMAQALATRNPSSMRVAAKTMRTAGLLQEAHILEMAADAIEAANSAAAAAGAAAGASAAASSAATSAAAKKPAPDIVHTTPGIIAQAQTAAKPAVATMPPAVQQAVNDALAAAAAAATQAQQAANGATGAKPAPVQPVPAAAATDPVVGAAEALTSHLMNTGRYKEDRKRVAAFQTMAGLKADGKYGVGTALAISNRGVIPARPFYYSPNKNTAAKQKLQWRSAMQAQAKLDPQRASLWLNQSHNEKD